MRFLALALLLGTIFGLLRVFEEPPRVASEPQLHFPFGPLPTTPRSPDTDRAFELVDTALVKVWALPDPRELLSELLRSAVQVDPAKGCDRIRQAMAELAKRKLPSQRRNLWGSLATDVTPWDLKLRDELLAFAIAEGRRALADRALWVEKPLPPGTRSMSDPVRISEFQKGTLYFDMQVWRAILDRRVDRAATVARIVAVVEDARAKGYVSLGCLIRDYEGPVIQSLSALDPSLYIAAMGKVWGIPRTAEYACAMASGRWSGGRRDSITGAFATYAIDNGVSGERVSEVMMHYDLQKAWKLAPQPFLLAHWAWIDPDAALAAAEACPAGEYRETMIQAVASVWAYKCPERIDRGVRYLGNSWQWDRLRKAAADELEWRRLGNAPRNTRSKAASAMDPYEGQYSRRTFERAGANPDTLRVLGNPHDTSWLNGPTREIRLNEAAEIAYFESDKPATLWKIIPLLADSTLPDHELIWIARSKALNGSPAEAIVLAARIRSAQQYVWATTYVVGAIHGRGD